jgi:hypothetical protein
MICGVQWLCSMACLVYCGVDGCRERNSPMIWNIAGNRKVDFFATNMATCEML